MADTKHLIQRNGLYLFNWRVPKDCIDIFNGKKFVTKSLQTHSLREAKYRRTQMLAEVERTIQEHRHGHCDASQYRENVRAMLQHSDDDLEGAYSALTIKLERLLREKGEPDLSYLSEELIDLTASEREQRLKEERLKAYTDLLPDRSERIYAKALQNSYLGIQHDLAHITLQEALGLHLRDNGQRLKTNTQTQTKKSVERFLEFMKKPDVSLKSIGRRTVKEFISDVTKVRKGATVGNYVSFMSSIWQHAHDLEMVSGDNPFKGHKIDSKPTSSYEMFSDEELTALFKETAQFSDCTDDFYKYLIPRLGYTTGCRIEELCSLKCEQVVTDQDSGISFIEVREGKTENAKRKIPLHDWVAAEVIRQRDAIGTGLLFPNLTTQRNDGKHGDKVSKWFGRLKKKHGITQRSKAFHSFRVHVATNLERGSIPESTAVWILGHTRNLSLSYGLYSKGMDLKQLKKAIDVIPQSENW